MRDSGVEVFDLKFNRAVVLPFKWRATQSSTTSRVRRAQSITDLSYQCDTTGCPLAARSTSLFTESNLN